MAFLGVQLLLVLQPAGLGMMLWLLFGFCGSTCILPYAVLTQQFPPRLAGRGNTGLNLLVFLAAFAVQWGVGAIIGQWPGTAAGGYDPTGYRWGFAPLAALQIVGAGWYWKGAARAAAARRIPQENGSVAVLFDFRVVQHRAFLQAFVVEVLSVEHGRRVVAGDAVLDHQGGDRRLRMLAEQHVVADA